MKRILPVITVSLLLSQTLILKAQKMLVMHHEGLPRIVKEVTFEDFVAIGKEGALEVPRPGAKVYLQNHSSFLPGYIEIKNESAVEWDTDDQNNSRKGLYFFRYNTVVTPNRDIKNPYIVFEWMPENDTALIEIVPIESLEAGKETPINLSFWVRNRYRAIDPQTYYMSLGFEIATSNQITKPLTPYAYALDKAEGNTLPDGNIKPLSYPPLPKLQDEAGNPMKGMCRLLISIDEAGYVSNLTVKEYSEWIFARAAMLSAPFFMFQPKIVDGEPVPTQVVIPFQF